MPCHGFVKYENATDILTCCRKLVWYYLSKGFVIFDKKSYDIKNFPQHVKQQIHTKDLHPNDYVMTWNRAIPSVDNNLKIFTLVLICMMDLNQIFTMINVLPLNISSGNIKTACTEHCPISINKSWKLYPEKEAYACFFGWWCCKTAEKN